MNTTTNCAIYCARIAGIGLFFAVAASAQAPKSATPKPAVARRKIAPEEKVFVGAAMSYLKTASDQGTKVAVTMAGASTGKSTLTDIENAVKRAASVENAGFVGDYKAKFKATPALFAANAKDIEEAHRLFQSAMAEYKKFFSTQSAAYIQSAQGPFRRSIELQNKTTADLNKKLATLAP